MLFGVALLALGSALHLWAKGCLQQNRVLTVCGPYRWCRHPFYLANLLVDLGLGVFSGRPELALLVAPVWFAAYRRQIRSEEATLERLFGEQWLHYRQRVPALLPWRRPFRPVPEGQSFSWHNPNISLGSELPRLMRVASYPLLIILCAGLRREGPAFLRAHPAGGLTLLTGFVSLQLLAAALKRQLRRRRPLLPHGLQAGIAKALLAGCYLTVLLLLTHPEWEADAPAIALGALALLVGLFWTLRAACDGACWKRTLAWAAAVTGAALMAEIPWVAPPALATLVCVQQDRKLRRWWNGLIGNGGRDRSPSARPAASRTLSAHLGPYLAFCLLVVAITVLKEVCFDV